MFSMRLEQASFLLEARSDCLPETGTSPFRYWPPTLIFDMSVMK